MKFGELVIGQIPEVGTVWKHPGDSDIFMRIQDHYGMKIFYEDASSGERFYSVRLRSRSEIRNNSSGAICHTGKDGGPFEVLI